MDIKKGVSYAAIGYLLTMLNLNLTINGETLPFSFAVIGWILLYIALNALGKYAENKGFLKVMALVLAFLAAIMMAVHFVLPDWYDILNSVHSFLETISLFLVFDILQEVAHDYGSAREKKIELLKYINLVVMLVLTAMGYLYSRISLDALALGFAALGVIGIIAAITSVFVLFGLRKEIRALL